MEIRIRETGTVVFELEFRVYAETQGGVINGPLTEDFINQYGGDVVLAGTKPSPTRYQYIERIGTEQIDGKWYIKYAIGPSFTDIPATETTPAKTAAEQEAAYNAKLDANRVGFIRNERNALLTRFDWTQLADAPVDKAAWAAYRQKLRDVPAQTGFPWEVTWPDAP